MARSFSLNGKTYLSDEETVKTLASIIPAAKANGDTSAVQAMIVLGLKTGRIKEA